MFVDQNKGHMQIFNSIIWYLAGALSKKPSDARLFARENCFPKFFKKWSKILLHTKIQPPSYLIRPYKVDYNTLLVRLLLKLTLKNAHFRHECALLSRWKPFAYQNSSILRGCRIDQDRAPLRPFLLDLSKDSPFYYIN